MLTQPAGAARSSFFRRTGSPIRVCQGLQSPGSAPVHSRIFPAYTAGDGSAKKTDATECRAIYASARPHHAGSHAVLRKIQKSLFKRLNIRAHPEVICCHDFHHGLTFLIRNIRKRHRDPDLLLKIHSPPINRFYRWK